jgi:hypothetical protein
MHARGRPMSQTAAATSGAAGSLFLIVHNVKQRDHEVQSRARRPMPRVRVTRKLQGRGPAVPIGSVKRAHHAHANAKAGLFMRNLADLWPSCLSAEGFCPPPG